MVVDHFGHESTSEHFQKTEETAFEIVKILREETDAAHMISWGRAGVKSVPGTNGESFRRAHEHWPEQYRFWAVVNPPEEEE